MYNDSSGPLAGGMTAVERERALVRRDVAAYLGVSEEEAMQRFRDIAREMYSIDIHSYKGFRPLSDQVLVRPLPAGDRLSSSSLILIPGTHDRGRLDNRLGTVLALGPGDPVAVKCEVCDGTGESPRIGIANDCLPCRGTGYLPHTRTSFEVAVGDTVLFAPRGWAEIELDGETLCVLHDCQHVIAVVDPDAVLFTEDPSTKKKAPDWVR